MAIWCQRLICEGAEASDAASVATDWPIKSREGSGIRLWPAVRLATGHVLDPGPPEYPPPTYQQPLPHPTKSTTGCR